MIHDEISDILSIAVHAPSSGNVQPWRFKVHKYTVTIYNIPDRDQSPYNVGQRISYMAHGALIENICLIATTRGFATFIELFPGEEDCVARITFTPTQEKNEPLSHMIDKRVTNRRMYLHKSLELPHRAELEASVQPFEGVQVRLIEGDDVHMIAHALSLCEKLTFENQTLYSYFYSIMRWSPESEMARPGLFIDTLEFSWWRRLVTQKILSKRLAVVLLNKLHLSRAASKFGMHLYARSSAIGALIINEKSDEAYIQAGRALQRFWLTATRVGVSMQPLVSLPFLQQYISEDAKNPFTLEQRKEIGDAYAKLASEYALKDGEHIVMYFRLGYAGEPSVRSVKRPPEIMTYEALKEAA